MTSPIALNVSKRAITLPPPAPFFGDGLFTALPPPQEH